MDTVLEAEDVCGEPFFCSGYLFSIGLSTNEEEGVRKFVVGVSFNGPALDFVPGVYDKESADGPVMSYAEFQCYAERSIPTSRDGNSLRDVCVNSNTSFLAYRDRDFFFNDFPTIGPVGTSTILSELLAEKGYVTSGHLP